MQSKQNLGLLYLCASASAIWTPNPTNRPPRNPAAPLNYHSSMAIGSFGLALGEIYLAKRQ